MSTKHDHIADLLMGAALADQHLDGREYEAVKQLLAKAMRRKSVPAALEQRLKNFKASKFDAIDTVKKLRLTSAKEKRNLLELIAKVHDSDDLWDFDEDAYLRKIAAALGVDESVYKDLTVEVLSIETIGDEILGPPPLPKT